MRSQAAKGERVRAADRLQELMEERIVVLDGSWGVLMHRMELTEEEYRGERFADHPRDLRGDPDLLNLTRPELVLDTHRAYLAAGADITTTNTFTATTIGQADYALGEHACEMSLAGARLASPRQVARHPRQELLEQPQQAGQRRAADRACRLRQRGQQQRHD